MQIEMISLCATDGKLTPLRFRLEDESQCLRTVVITQIVCIKSIQYAGIDAIQYICKAMMDGHEKMYELRYTIATHRWSVFRVLY